MPDKPIYPPIWILIAATATGPLALNIFVPSMPGLVRVFDTDYATIQLTLTLYLVGVALAQLAYGPLSDRFGRRPALLWGLAIYAVREPDVRHGLVDRSADRRAHPAGCRRLRRHGSRPGDRA